MCHAFSNGNDCTALEANASCSFLRTECLDEELNGACQVEERIYRCPTPGGAVSDAPQYICGDDVYYINGECEPIVREASIEFKDALVALHAIAQAGTELDENNFTVFQASSETSPKPVYGVIICSAANVSGLWSLVAAGAVLA